MPEHEAQYEAQVDVAVVGAGLAGLVCAQRLRQAGLRVILLEKSRGLGGRLATRRLAGTCADHGVRCLEVQGALTALLIPKLVEQHLLQPWLTQLTVVEAGQARSAHRACYSAVNGLTAVAKWLAADLEIWSGQRLQQIAQAGTRWQLTLEAQNSAAQPPLLASAVVMAIPAPQALTLLEPLAAQLPDLIQAIQEVEFAPCLTVIASYTASAELPPPAVQFLDDANLAWISLESSKGRDPQIPTLIVQSSSAFAVQHLESNDLKSAGGLLLHQAVAALNLPRWLEQPAEQQVHRWRYGFVSQPLAAQYLSQSKPLPLVCAGDWCGGSNIEAALASGLAAAAETIRLLEKSAEPLLEVSSANFSSLLEQIAQP